jgi:peptidyl-prolyl cis-trans isomerase B (cyclophilin B)
MAKNRKAEVEAAQKGLDFNTKKYQLELDTSLGKITLDMLPDVAPGHCRNMLALAKIGYYDGLGFHRIIKGFMIQGGCPEGTGTGGPGYTIPAEFNSTKHVAGVLSMARTSDPNSAGSQFFICLEAASHLDRQYTAFGRTADDASLAVVKSIGNVKTGANDKPATPVSIKTAKVIETAK